MSSCSKPIRILHVLGALNIGGAEMMVMNLYRNIDRERVQFDFVIHTTEHCDFTEEILALGGLIYSCPRYVGKNHLQYCKWWRNFLTEHEEYQIIHGHVRSTAFLYIAIGKRLGRVTIVHSHSTSNGKGIQAMVKAVMQFPLRYQADYLFSCSKKSGEWLYGKKAISSKKHKVIKNAIDTGQFLFEMERREEVRKKLGIEVENIVFGHIGRFHEAKNYPFLIDVFEAIYKENKNARMIFVGDGELRGFIEDKIKMHGLENVVMLLGVRKDTNDLMQAMDVFLFPSKWEGLPVTIVEAQAAGLPCFVSDRVTKEVKVSELVEYLPIDRGTKIWADAINTRELSRKNVLEEIMQSGFDIHESSEKMVDFYTRIKDAKIYYET